MDLFGFATVDLWNWCADLHNHNIEYCDKVPEIHHDLNVFSYIHQICTYSMWNVYQKWLDVRLAVRCKFFKSSDSINHQNPFEISYISKYYVQRRGRSSGKSIPFIYLVNVKRKGNIRHSCKITSKHSLHFGKLMNIHLIFWNQHLHSMCLSKFIFVNWIDIKAR